jgi:hypothetical protein
MIGSIARLAHHHFAGGPAAGQPAPAPLTTAGSVAPCVLALALLSPRAVGRDETECAVEGAPEGAGVAAGLGEDEAALDAGQGGGREPVRVGAGPEFTGGNHGRQASPDVGLPAVKPIRQDGPDVVVALADLAKEAGDRAASFPAPLLLDSYKGIGPAHQAGPGAETGEEVFLGAEHRVVGRLGHGSQQVSLVAEVVVQLAARSGGAGSDLVQARPQRSLLGDDLGGGGHDALPGPASPLGSWLVSHVLQYHGYWT